MTVRGIRTPPVDAPLVERYAHMAHTFERRPVDRVLRALDILIGAALLVLTAPLMGVAALAVRLTGRPILYRGRRVGRGGAVFTMYKFRTLRKDSEVRLTSYPGPHLTHLTVLEQTTVGRMLRATKVDELPQLYNVVRGEMSLVGPRPIRPAFFEELCLDISAYWQRLVVPPGLTGLAQLRMSREMSWAEKLAHDVEYISDRSVGLYLSVLVQTAAHVLAGRWGD